MKPTITTLNRSICSNIITKKFTLNKLSENLACGATSLVLTTLAITATSISASAFAVTPAQAIIPHTTLEPIVVTATRTPTKVSDTIVQTTVIDSEDLKRFKGQTVLEVIKRQPGFSFKQDGGMGQSSNFYVRGYDSKQVLVLINGIRYASMSTGQPALSLLPADQVDRIEILYGAAGSSIYGSDAMGGVIQIFTKGRDAFDSGVSANVAYGSNNHIIYGASAQWLSESQQGAEPTVVSIAASHNETDGISALTRQTGNNADDDGFDSDNASIYISTPVSNTLTVGATGLYSDSTTEFDNYDNIKDAYIDQKNGAYSVFTQYNNEGQSIEFTAGQSLDEVDNNVGDRFETIQTQATLTGGYALPMGNVIAGLEFLRQEVDVNPDKSESTYAFEKNERDIKSGFLGYQISADNYDFQANVRHDDNSQFDSETTYGVGASYNINDNVRIGGSHSTGFRAPTLNDLYVQSSYYVPSPNLEVETSKNNELFIEYNSDNNSTRLTGYHSDVDNLIVNQYDSTVGKFQAQNIDEARIKGASLTSNWEVDNYLFGIQYDHTNAEDNAGSNKGKQLVYRPEDAGLVYAGYRGQNFDLRGEVQYTGERYNSFDNSTSLPDYTLVNLSANYELSPQISVTTRINNLLNEDYSTNETYGPFGTRYNHDGTNYLVSLTYTSN